MYGVDDLQSVIDENLAQRRQAAVEAEVMVNQLATQLIVQQKVNQAGPIIKSYRDQGEQNKEQELKLALERLQSGEDAELVMQEFAHRLTQKLLHPTSLLLREVAKSEDPSNFEGLKESLDDIFQKQRKAKH